MMNARFLAMSDPTRRAILARLAEGEASVNDLAAPFSMSQPAISQHIKVLENAGLILRRVDGQRRPCRLAPHTLEPMQAFLAKLATTFEANYSRLDALLTPPSATKD